ncbi:PPOX class F420-dependent oxidoreductase [Nocardia veterana]|uniref:PPOX class F420-dependent oxidoreductase n=1 Tax=Nocardia veterana TaxID=132249 RepID=A0A7X6M1K2_9NOCA|nr:PPOX class F420-dependent oxidoreductase [Nocardia veterana]NKY88094.1 PPOX class F420-dependent oxidoreductase [Nocardia veterana]
MTWNELAQQKYVLLTTYKKDGTPVGTPVWVAPDGDRLVVWTNPKTWKVKRLRRNAAVTLQACDNRGRPKGTEVSAGTARILDEAGTERVRDLIARKYGLIGTLLIRAHKLILGKHRSVGLAITAEPAAP